MEKGFTTGSAATAAVKAALTMLLTGATPKSMSIALPGGGELTMPVESYCGRCDDVATAAVRKNAGGDYDVTHGAIITAAARLTDTPEIVIKGGIGVGTVTKAGLPIPIGESAINPTPREMIRAEARGLLPTGRGAEITISVPEGEALAEKTHNAKLGIIGGISIIGTTGIVEPKSLEAYKKSLAVELDVIAASGAKEVALILGYVGEKYCAETLNMSDEAMIKIGDHVGFMLKECAERGIKKVLLAGHIGKLIKLTNGQFNTHINHGDKRISSLAEYATRAGASAEVIKKIEDQTMAEAVVDIIKLNGLTELFDRVAGDAVAKIDELVSGRLDVSCVILSLDAEVIGRHKP